MTNTKWYNENVSSGRGTDPNIGKVVIDVDAYDEDRVKEWICSNCNYILKARKSRKEIDCPNCTATLDLCGATQETKTLEDPNKGNAPNEVHAFTTPEVSNPWDKKGPELKGGFLALSKRGLRITNYRDSSAGKEGAD